MVAGTEHRTEFGPNTVTHREVEGVPVRASVLRRKDRVPDLGFGAHEGLFTCRSRDP